MRDMEHQRQIIDTFVNSVYVFDDRVVLNFNFTDDAKTVTREEVLGSSAVENAPPQKSSDIRLRIFYLQFVQNPHKETPFLSGTIRVQSGRTAPRELLPKPANAGKNDRRKRGPFKILSPPPMRGNSQRRRTDYQIPPDSRKCLGVHHTDRQHRFLLLSTVAACLFVFPFLKQSAKKGTEHFAPCLLVFWGKGQRRSRRRSAGRWAFRASHPASRLSFHK